MSKTTYSDGSFATPDFLNTLYNTFTDSSGTWVGGHQHDGLQLDGHASQINLQTQTQGQLPVSMLGWPDPSYSGSGYAYIDGSCLSSNIDLPVPITWQLTGNFLSLSITADTSGTSVISGIDANLFNFKPGDMTLIQGFNHFAVTSTTRIPCLFFNGGNICPGNLLLNNSTIFNGQVAPTGSTAYTTSGFSNSLAKGLPSQTIQFYL
jgi:hypothetical protein